MTDQEMGEIYAVAREALGGGQGAFQLQSFPFRMTAENIAKYRKSPNIGFWRNLKDGSDTFEVTKQPVTVAQCRARYVFNGDGGDGCNLPAADPTVVAAVAEKRKRDEARVASLVASGTPAVNVIYEDGGSNPAFAGRSVDSHSVPGRDRPYNRVSPPVVVALNESGAPASEADANAAAKATYSAAETLLMAEAALARRPVGPQKPEVVAKRQEVVYAKLIGGKLPPKPAPAPAPVVVASAAPAPAAASGATAEEQPFYARWLGFADDGSTPKAPAAPISAPTLASVSAPVTTGSVPANPVENPSILAEPVSSDAPFYRRWLGLGSGSDAPPPVSVAAPAAPMDAVPVPPSRPRTAGLSGKSPIFTSLGE